MSRKSVKDERRRSTEAVMDSLEKVFNSARDVLEQDLTLIVAVSGGPDSICLLHALHTYTEDLMSIHVNDPVQVNKGKFKLQVAHLHHGQRKEGDEDAIFVQKFADNFNLNILVGYADVPQLANEERLSIEAAGRVARYRFFSQLAEELNASAVATGHHADDQAETVLLRAFRGAGLRGLRGIPALGPMPESGGTVTVIRPLLGVTRTQIEAYLAYYDLPSRTDATNLDLSLQRNRIRHELLPLAESISPGARNGLLRIAQDVGEDEEALQAWTAQAWEACCWMEGDRVVIHLDALPEPAAIRRRLLRRAIETLRPETGLGFPEVTIRWLLTLCVPGAGSGVHVLAEGLEAFREIDQAQGQTRLILLVRQKKEVNNHEHEFNVEVNLSGTTELHFLNIQLVAEVIAPGVVGTYPPREAWEAVLDADALAVPCFIRSWLPGDQIRVLGSGGTRKLQDLFTDAKTPASDRRRWPILCDGEKIVWVPGLALHNGVKVTPDTRRILRVRLLTLSGEEKERPESTPGSVSESGLRVEET